MIGIVDLRRQYTGAGVVKGFINLVAGKPSIISFLLFKQSFINRMTICAVKGYQSNFL